MICREAVNLYAVLERPFAVQYGWRVYALETSVSSIVMSEDETIGMDATRDRTLISRGDCD